VLVVGIVLLKKLFKFIVVVACGVLGMVAALFMGPAALLAILLEKCANALRLKLVMRYHWRFSSDLEQLLRTLR